MRGILDGIKKSLVIVDDDTPPEKLTFRAGYEARLSCHGAADVVACRARTYEIKSRIAGTLPYAAARDGVVVYPPTGHSRR